MDTERKISDYPISRLSIKGTDRFLAIRDVNSIPQTVTFEYSHLFSNVSVPTTFANTLTANAVSVSSLVIRDQYTPSSSSSPAIFGAVDIDEDYLYVAVGPNKRKRIKLEDFD